jgi:hypothetical protein
MNYIIQRPTPSKAWVHCLLHSFATEGVVGVFMFHVVCAIEAVLVAPPLLIARGTCAPILHIKPTAVADILVCKHH